MSLWVRYVDIHGHRGNVWHLVTNNLRSTSTECGLRLSEGDAFEFSEGSIDRTCRWCVKAVAQRGKAGVGL